MKQKLLFLLSGLLLATSVSAQEKYGKTLNAGIGATYYGYVGAPSPVIMVDFEIDLVKNITLAPFIGAFAYSRHYDYYYGPGNKYGHPYYATATYRQTVIPFGVKGTYYFDELLKANKDWDFYAAMSLGFAFRSTHWDDDYYSDYYDTKGSGVYANLHVGAEYHINKKIGVYADASLGMLLVGVSVHP